MKQFLYSLILLACLAGPVNAQLFELKQGLSAKKTLIDYNTLRDKDAAALKDMADGFELAYLRRFSKNFVLSAPLALGRYVDSIGDGEDLLFCPWAFSANTTSLRRVGGSILF